MMADLISIIVPVYNTDRYLQKCLDSLSGQTYQNLEIILVDDGSTDQSRNICYDQKSKDARFKVIHQDNKGVSAARNAGLNCSTGNYIGFVDSDDWCEPDMYERLYNQIRTSNADVVMCGFVDYPYGESAPVAKGSETVRDGRFDQVAYEIIRKNGYFTSVWNKLFRRSAICNTSGPVMFDQQLAFGEDELWLFQVLKKCSKISFLPAPLYHWRDNAQSITRNHTALTRKRTLVTAKERALSLLPQNKQIQRIERGEIYNMAHRLKTDAYIENDINLYREIIQHSKPYLLDCLESSEISTIRKIKMAILNMCMSLGLSKKWIEKISKKTDVKNAGDAAAGKFKYGHFRQ